jgi:hypothetical protein
MRRKEEERRANTSISQYSISRSPSVHQLDISKYFMALSFMNLRTRKLEKKEKYIRFPIILFFSSLSTLSFLGWNKRLMWKDGGR